MAARISYLSICYLFISIILWVAGWFQWWVSIPVCFLLIYGLLSLRKEATKSYSENRHVTWWGWVLLILYAAVCVFLCGFDGRVHQSWDFIVRNPLYAHLIHHDWPVQLSNGGHVVYPVPFWLVPAALSKFFPSHSTLFLQLWVFIGLLLTSLNIWQVLGGVRSLIMLGCILVFAPLSQVADDVLNVVFHEDAFFSVHFRLLHPLSQMLNTFHFYVIGSLCLSLLVERRPSCPTIVAITSAFAIMHPMLAVILFPWVLCKYICTWRKASFAWRGVILHPVLPGMICAATLAGVFYGSSTGSEVCLVFDAPYAKGYSPQYIGAFALGVLIHTIPLLFAWYYSRRGILLYLACCIPVLTLFWMGQENGINEWWYKFSVAYGFILLLALLLAWNHKITRVALLCFMGFSLLTFLREMDEKQLAKACITGFAPQAEFVASQYADMNQLDSSLYKQFVSERLLLPQLFRIVGSKEN